MGGGVEWVRRAIYSRDEAMQVGKTRPWQDQENHAVVGRGTGGRKGQHHAWTGWLCWGGTLSGPHSLFHHDA